MVHGVNYFLDSLEKKYELKNEFDKVVQNTEGAFIKVFLDVTIAA